MATTTEEHRVGRPRSAEADAAIREATFELLASEGYAGLTMSGVAHRAGVSTATLYRRWHSKLEMVVDILAAGADEQVVPDTGSLEGDVRELLGAFTDKARTSRAAAIMAGLIAEQGRNPELAAALRTNVRLPRRAAMSEVFKRARARGQMRNDVDFGIATDLLFGPLTYRLLVSGEPVTPRVAENIGDLVLQALRP